MKISQFMPDDLRKEFNKIMKEKTQNPDTQIELEARFGYYTDDSFNSKLIDKSLYLNVEMHLDNLYDKNSTSMLKIKTHRIVDIGSSNIRKIQEFSGLPELPGRTYYQRKKRDWCYDNKDWGIRFSRSHETEIDESRVLNFKTTLRRDIDRTTYIDKRFNSQFFGFKIEISKVCSNNETNYELELEALSDSILTIDKWWGALKTLYGWTLNAKNSEEIISVKERLIVSRNLNKLLNDNHNYFILPSIVNRPKIFTDLKDMENKAVSVKIDGLHKILYFCKTGVYSCSPSLNITKISNIATEKSTIIECEYLSSMNIHFGFDILIYQNSNVKSVCFTERYNLLFKFINSINSDLIKSKIWYFPENQRDIIPSLEDSEVPIDGLIFQSMGNYEQEIYKWKPPENLTIDFYIQLRYNRTYEIYAFKSKRLYLTNFKISEGFVISDEIHKKIVECKWIPDQNSWEPIKIRHDKLNPNSYELVESTLKMLKDPITIKQIVNNLK